MTNQSCPWCGGTPSWRHAFQSFDMRVFAEMSSSYDPGAPPPPPVPILTFCSKDHADAFWDEEAERLKAEREAGR